jgi:hypothetical protein
MTAKVSNSSRRSLVVSDTSSRDEEKCPRSFASSSSRGDPSAGRAKNAAQAQQNARQKRNRRGTIIIVACTKRFILYFDRQSFVFIRYKKLAFFRNAPIFILQKIQTIK